jgi:hypothetical protein
MNTIFTPEQKHELERLSSLTKTERTLAELASGVMRYEKLRTMNVLRFAELSRLNLEGHRFDDLIDLMIANNTSDPIPSKH